jgi:hypothetical protein
MTSYGQAEIIEDRPVETEDVKENLLEKFCIFFKGEYNTQSQNAQDTNYFNISLIMFSIWEKETDARYFYVEQAMVGKEDKPYRQRVYKVYQTGPTTIVSAIYTIKKQEEFVKLHESTKKQKALTKEEIDYKEGCDVFLEFDGVRFFGGTTDKKCLSSLRGAKYTTTEVQVFEDKLISWDRGFTENGIHAWGATAGGYVFDKIR